MSECFYPRTPRGVRLFSPLWTVAIMSVSIHAPLVECDSKDCPKQTYLSVSIHAPLVECDKRKSETRLLYHGFYPRTPRGVRPFSVSSNPVADSFLSTHPSWSATVKSQSSRTCFKVSIHAPLVECDLPLIYPLPHLRGFLSTHPSWSATEYSGRIHQEQGSFYPRTPRGVRHGTVSISVDAVFVSIHAPLVECDNDIIRRMAGPYSFYPRTPRGVRRIHIVIA